jgi:tetratricopeptide (TPR) repeat protein
MRLRLSILAIFLGASGIVLAEPGADFEQANRLFESGDFAGAKTAYETLVRADHLSPELFYNLGAAHHRAGQSGEGVLWMRRALVLDPGMAEARQSLAFLRSRLGSLEFSESGLARFIAALPPGFGAWSVSLCVWIACLSAAAGLFLPRLRPSRPAFLTLAVLLLVTAVVVHLVSRYRSTNLAVENFATVLSAETDAFTSPTPDAKKVIDLPPGSEVRLLQRSDKWSYVEIPGDLRGWVRSDTIAPVWPIERPTGAP